MIFTFIGFLIGILQLYLGVLFMGLFMVKKPERTRRLFACLLAMAAGMTVVNLFNYALLNIAAVFIVYTCLGIVLFEASIGKTILASLSTSIVFVLCELTNELIVTSIIGVHNSVIVNSPLAVIAITLMSCLLYFAIYWLIRLGMRVRHGDDLSLKLNTNSGVFLMMLVSLFIAYYALMVQRAISDNTHLTDFGFICFFLLLGVNIYILIGSESDRKQLQLKNELELMRRQEEQIAITLAVQEEYLEKMKSQAHDHQNQLLLLQDLMETNQSHELYASTKQFISDIVKETENTFSSVQNRALRRMLDNLAKRCLTENIVLTTQITYSVFDFITLKDLCTLFSNAFDNALFACTQISNPYREKSIQLSINKKNDMVFVKVINSKDNAIVNEHGRLMSTKPDAWLHGIGIKNMERVSKIYEGDVVCCHNTAEFTLIITLVATNQNG